MLISSDVNVIANIIAQGGLVAYPTEAVFGLGCDPHNQATVQRLLGIKQRPVEKGLIVIAAQRSQLTHYIVPPDRALEVQLAQTWPGATTWLIEASQSVPVWIRGSHSTIAVRVSAHPACQQLCLATQSALVSTSANPASYEPARTIATLCDYFSDTDIDAIFDAPLGQSLQPTEIRDSRSNRIIRPS